MKGGRWAWLLGGVTLLGLLAARPTSGADDVRPLLARLRAVGAEGAGNAEAAAAWKQLVRLGLDPDQVDQIAAKLRELGTEVDLAAHFGFLRRWWLLGPFDNHGGLGFDTAFPPEKKVDLAGHPRGKGGAELRWAHHTTNDPYG